LQVIAAEALPPPPPPPQPQQQQQKQRRQADVRRGTEPNNSFKKFFPVVFRGPLEKKVSFAPQTNIKFIERKKRFQKNIGRCGD